MSTTIEQLMTEVSELVDERKMLLRECRRLRRRLIWRRLARIFGLVMVCLVIWAIYARAETDREEQSARASRELIHRLDQDARDRANAEERRAIAERQRQHERH